jgi:hypothetical protein
MAKSSVCAGPVTRRTALQIGAIGATGLGAADLFRLRAEAALPGAAQDTAVIYLWLGGGCSQLETYDLKPDAPAEVRGKYKPIKTRVPGIEICELLPRQAAVADKFTLIRTMKHRFSDHGGGSKRVMTGREPRTPTGTVNEDPAIPSVVSKFIQRSGPMPPNIVLGDSGSTAADGNALGAAYLGSAHNPFEVDGDPSDKKFKVGNISLKDSLGGGRLADWIELLQGIDRIRRDLDRSGSMAAMDKFNAQACGLFTSKEIHDAFDLSQESDKVREDYGMHAWGQRCLMARRLVEAGSSFVTVLMTKPTPSNPENAWYNWDCHAVNCDLFVDMEYRAPYFDQAVAALISDLYARGLDKKVLLVVTGEFGHTPRLEHKDAKGRTRPGRDHWPHTFSLLVSGGGLKMGQVIGETDPRAAYPKDRPVLPEELWATVYRHLGIDTSGFMRDLSDRPIPILPHAKPIKELYG